MHEPMEKWVGSIVEIIYMDRFHRFSQRKIKMLSVQPNTVRAYCLHRQAPRTFRRENILAFAKPEGTWSA